MFGRSGENSSHSRADVCEQVLLNLHGVHLTLGTVAARIAPTMFNDGYKNRFKPRHTYILSTGWG